MTQSIAHAKFPLQLVLFVKEQQTIEKERRVCDLQSFEDPLVGIFITCDHLFLELFPKVQSGKRQQDATHG